MLAEEDYVYKKLITSNYADGTSETLEYNFIICESCPSNTMTNRDWLQALDDRTFAREVNARSKDSYAFLQWLQAEYKGEIRK